MIKLHLNIVFIILTINTAILAHMNIRPGIIGGRNIFTFGERDTFPVHDHTCQSYYKNKIGFVAGVLLEIRLLNYLYIEPSIVFSTRGTTDTGFSFSGTGYKSTYKQSFAINYLTIPIHAKLKYPFYHFFVPYIVAGINTGLLLSAKGIYPSSAYPTEEFDIKQKLDHIDIGFDFGTGLEINLHKIIPFVEYIYYYGLSNIGNASDIGTGNNGFNFNKGMEIKCGLKFEL
jgi:hypothetical protein